MKKSLLDIDSDRKRGGILKDSLKLFSTQRNVLTWSREEGTEKFEIVHF